LMPQPASIRHIADSKIAARGRARRSADALAMTEEPPEETGTAALS
jgi:hypothetical protein